MCTSLDVLQLNGKRYQNRNEKDILILALLLSISSTVESHPIFTREPVGSTLLTDRGAVLELDGNEGMVDQPRCVLEILAGS